MSCGLFVPSSDDQRARLRRIARRLAQTHVIAPHPSDALTQEVVGRLCVDVEIRRMSDGVTRKHADTSGFQIMTVGAFLVDAGDLTGSYNLAIDAAADSARYWWNEGNAACDCNRSLFHYRAGVAAGVNEPPPTAGSICTGRDGYELVSPAWLIENLTSEN